MKYWPIVVATLCFGIVSVSDADVVFLKDGKPPIFGLVAEQQPKQIVFRERFDTGKYVERTIPRDQILDLVVTVDAEQLKRLSPSRPSDYVALAETLSEARRDPEANDLAIRLYLIASHLTAGSDNRIQKRLRRRCLLGLVPLARDEREEVRFRALAFLHIDSLEPEFLAPVKWKAQKGDDRQATQELLDLVVQIRRGNGTQVRASLNDSNVKTRLREYESLCTWQDLFDASRVNQMTLEQMRRVVHLELKLRDKLKEEGASTAHLQGSWSADVRRNRASWTMVPRVETVTEFDPRAYLFRRGEWIAPRRDWR